MIKLIIIAELTMPKDINQIIQIHTGSVKGIVILNVLMREFSLKSSNY